MLGTVILGAAVLASQPATHRPPRTTDPFASEAIVPLKGASDEALDDSMAIGADQTDRMTVRVNIGGRGPFAFLVDTGSERTAISRQLANRLNLATGAPARVHSVFGSEMVDTAHIRELSVGKQTVSVANAPTFEARHIGADGVLGIDTLRSQRVMFDFKAREMRITPSRFRDLGSVDDKTIVVRARARAGRLILTNVIVDGVRIAAIIDTGSEVSIGNPLLLRRLRRARNINAGLDEQAIITAVTGQARSVPIMHIKRLKLGGVELENSVIAFDDAHIFGELGYGDRPALLLGMDALRAFDKVSIDFANKKVRFVLPGFGMLDQSRLAER